MTYIHGRVEVGDGFVIGGELIYLHTVRLQLAHDLQVVTVSSGNIGTFQAFFCEKEMYVAYTWKLKH